MPSSNDVHVLFLAHTYETGASVWACADCEFVCIIKDNKSIALHKGNEAVYHVTQEELDNFMPGHVTSHGFAGEDELQDPITFEEQMELAHTSFYDWIADHKDLLESL